MPNSIRIKSRIGGAAGAPGAGALANGELAFNNNGNELWAGAAGASVTLVSASRQVETTGVQTGIIGQKNFQTLSFGTLATNNLFPLTRGLAGQILQADGAGNMTWATSAGTTISEEVVTLPGAGAINTEFDAAGVTVTPEEIIIVNHAGSHYLYIGPAGAPVAGSALASFVKVGEDNTNTLFFETGGVTAACPATMATAVKTGVNTAITFQNVNEPGGFAQVDLTTGVLPVTIMPFASPIQFKGGWDASGNTLPPIGTNITGDAWTITVSNTAALNIFITLNGTTNLSLTEIVSPGDLIIFDQALNGAAGGYWLIQTQSTVTAAEVSYDPTVGTGTTLTATNTQDAIDQLEADGELHVNMINPAADQSITSNIVGATLNLLRAAPATAADPVFTIQAGQTNMIRGDGATADQIDNCVLTGGTY